MFGLPQPAGGVDEALALVNASFAPNCAPGYAGRLCSGCTSGYYRKHGACAACPATGYGLLAMYIVAVVCLGVVLQVWRVM